MIKPVIYDELFDMNDGLTPEFYDGVIYVDNFYKHYEEIYEMLSNTSVNVWKYEKDSMNFIDYYDCRLTLENGFYSDKFIDRINSIIELIFYCFQEKKDVGIVDTYYRFNYYKNIKKNVSNDLQHYPHIDDVNNAYNAIVYLDKQCSGGTAIYPDIDDLENDEANNLLFDVSNTSKKIIQAKPNRLVIFRGDVYHGGYIEDHNTYTDENWRINQGMFFRTFDTND